MHEPLRSFPRCELDPSALVQGHTRRRGSSERPRRRHPDLRARRAPRAEGEGQRERSHRRAATGYRRPCSAPRARPLPRHIWPGAAARVARMLEARTDVVGSLLRPPELIEARERKRAA